MSEVILQRNPKGFDIAKKASMLYGNKFLDENLPILDENLLTGQSYISGWHIGATLLPTYELTDRPSLRYSISYGDKQGPEALLGEVTEDEGSFTQPDLLDSEEHQVQELIIRISKDSSIHYRQRLSSRLLTLFSDAKEEDASNLGISIDSLRNFYNFLRLHPNLKYPRISLSPDCNIYASWRDNHNQVFSIYFLSEKDAAFVVLKTNEAHPDRQIRVSGTITTDILMEKVAPYGVSYWISE